MVIWEIGEPCHCCYPCSDQHHLDFSTFFRLLLSNSRNEPATRQPQLLGIPELDIPPELPRIEDDLIKLFRLPPRAHTDASHLALAVLHRMDYLLTWNCAHLANASHQKELMEYCTYHSLHVPIICTPEALTQEEP